MNGKRSHNLRRSDVEPPAEAGRSRGEFVEPPRLPDDDGSRSRRRARWARVALLAFGLGLVLVVVFRLDGPRERQRAPSAEKPVTTAAAAPPDPAEVEAGLEQTQTYLGQRDLNAAWTEIRKVLKRSPQDPRALTYEGLILSAAGRPELAIGPLERAIGIDPELLEAHLQLAYADVKLGREIEADATISAASRRFPDKTEMMNRLLVKMRAQVAQDRAAAAGRR